MPRAHAVLVVDDEGLEILFFATQIAAVPPSVASAGALVVVAIALRAGFLGAGHVAGGGLFAVAIFLGVGPRRVINEDVVGFAVDVAHRVMAAQLTVYFGFPDVAHKQLLVGHPVHFG